MHKPQARHTKKIIALAIVGSLAAAGAVFYIHYKYQSAFSATLSEHEAPGAETSATAHLPRTLLLPVPFTPQAPTANWDTLHNEACEEAGSIMASEYFKGNTDILLAPALVETQITALTAWENAHLGYHLDTTSAETARMIEQVYGLHTRLIQNFTADELKTELAQKHLILISESGRDLHNPNYHTPGPIHHMLVLKGYTKDDFITNDPGTKNGRNYGYTFNTLYEAAADWNQKTETVDPTQKIAIVIWK